MEYYYSQPKKNIVNEYLKRWTKAHGIRLIEKGLRHIILIIPNMHSLFSANLGPSNLLRYLAAPNKDYINEE